jgi:hypothetical protein
MMPGTTARETPLQPNRAPNSSDLPRGYPAGDVPDVDYRAHLRTLGVDPDALAVDAKGTLAVQNALADVPGDPGGQLPRLIVATDDDPSADLLRHQVLGRGGMGVVWSGTQRALRRGVAVKQPLDTPTPGALGRLLREAMITGALEHPNIVPVHLLGCDAEGRPLLVMKRIEGTPWSELLSPLFRPSGAAPIQHIERQLGIFVQVCHAVEFAHSRGVVHRDLKPDNVMIGSFGEVYVLDWGVARVLDDRLDVPPLGRGSELVGTPAYMAPEMAAGDPELTDTRTDVYLLGAILHELVLGKRRHEGGGLFANLMLAYHSKSFEYPPWIPDELAQICNRATAAAPAERFPSVAELRMEIEGYLGHRASRELADKAGARLGALADLLGDDMKGRTFDAVEIHTLASEARFGLEQALAQWPGNREAAAGLQRLLELMIDYEISNDNVRAAAGLLAELPERRPAIEARLREAVSAASVRRQQIADMERHRDAGDLAVSAPLRLRLSIVYGTVLAGSIATVSLLKVLDVRSPGYPDALAVTGVFAITIWSTRRWFEAGNLVNRRIIDGIAVTCALIAAGFLLAWLGGVGFTAGLALSMLLAAGTTAMTAIYVERGLWFTALAFLATAAGVLLYPPARGLTMALGCLASFGAAALVWHRLRGGAPRLPRSVRATDLTRVQRIAERSREGRR